LGIINFEIQEDNFVKKSTSSYDLSILLGVDRFSYLITDQLQNVLVLTSYTYNEQIESFDDLPVKIKDIYLESKHLKLPYKSVRIAISNLSNTLVPGRLYQEGESKIYLENVVDVKKGDAVLLNDLSPLGIKNIFTADGAIIELLKSYYPSAEFYHGHSSVLLGFRKIVAHQSGQRVFICVKDRLVQVYYFNDTDLVFSNSFVFRTSKDFVYYVLLVFDQFNLKTETVPVTLAGKIMEGSEIYHLLYRYIRHLSKIDDPDFLTFGKRFGTTPKYLYFDLYTLRLCE